MKTFTRLMPVVMAVALAGCATLERLFEHETRLSLAEVPPVVTAAAEQAVPGLVLAEAEVASNDGTPVYELEGTADGKSCELKIRVDGTVLRIKRGDAKD